MQTRKAEITEVFSSIQGEGIFLGARQVFVRFKRCNRNCVFCDEPRDLDARSLTSLQLLTSVKFLEVSKGPHHSVSLTGGEPLLYADFLKVFLKVLNRNGFKSYLETNGTLPTELSKVVGLVDIIAMDFKLPSSTGEGECWDEHRAFLKMAPRKKVFVKAVITPNTIKKDVEIAAELIKEVDTQIPLILQPATPVSASDEKVDEKTLLRFLSIASRKLENVRAIPQIHKILNVK